MILVNQIILLIASLLAVSQFTASAHSNETLADVKEVEIVSTTSAPTSPSSDSSTLESKSTAVTTESPIFSLEISTETTTKPVEVVTEAPHVKVNHTTAEPTVPSQDDKEKPLLPKFCDYLKPICANLDEIQPKQMFKLQTQFKQFVQLTNGKLGICFLEHYMFDPTLKLLTKQDLVKICQSKDVSPNLRGSIKKFETCAVNYWEPAVDKELTRIIDARLNCVKNHNHTGKVPSNSSSIEHEDDENMSLINDVVNKVLSEEEKNSTSNKTEVNIIDMTTKSNSTSGSNSNLSPEAKGILNDPNTVLVFVDESPSSKATTQPAVIVHSTTTSAPTYSPKLSPTPAHATLNSTVDKEAAHKPEHTTESLNKPVIVHELVKSKTTEKPSEIEVEVVVEKSTTPLPSNVVKEVTTLSSLLKVDTTSSEEESTEAQPSLTTTSAPKLSTTPKVEVIVTFPTTVKPIIIKKTEVLVKSTSKPLKDLIRHTTIVPIAKLVRPTTQAPKSLRPWDTLESILRRQEKEKLEFEAKLRAEREGVIKMLQKKQDESDAQNAIKSLQQQREASIGHVTDNKLHAIEHERQMAIDPVGHTIKHQQYEINKQQRLAGAKM